MHKLSKASGHIDTLLPFVLRYSPFKANYKRERITTSDNDFLDLDWLYSLQRGIKQKLVILSYGLESDSNSAYVRRMSKFLSKRGYDVLVWNYRGCSGEANLTPNLYHSGYSHDLRFVIDYVQKNYTYDDLSLVGFSMGGNIALKYLGEEAAEINSNIKRACVFSTPCDLSEVSKNLGSGFSKIYFKSFVLSFIKKLKKMDQLPKEIKLIIPKLKEYKSLEEIDDNLTAKLNNFKNAKDYYDQCSSKHFIKSIKVKTLIINALNDPFLSGECYPYKQVKTNSCVDLETPSFGGHIGFIKKSSISDFFWSEKRLLNFLNENQKPPEKEIT